MVAVSDPMPGRLFSCLSVTRHLSESKILLEAAARGAWSEHVHAGKMDPLRRPEEEEADMWVQR